MKINCKSFSPLRTNVLATEFPWRIMTWQFSRALSRNNSQLDLHRNRISRPWWVQPSSTFAGAGRGKLSETLKYCPIHFIGKRVIDTLKYESTSRETAEKYLINLKAIFHWNAKLKNYLENILDIIWYLVSVQLNTIFISSFDFFKQGFFNIIYNNKFGLN